MIGPRRGEGARGSSFRKEGEKRFAVSSREPGICFSSLKEQAVWGRIKQKTKRPILPFQRLWGKKCPQETSWYLLRQTRQRGNIWRKRCISWSMGGAGKEGNFRVPECWNWGEGFVSDWGVEAKWQTGLDLRECWGTHRWFIGHGSQDRKLYGVLGAGWANVQATTWNNSVKALCLKCCVLKSCKLLDIVRW